MGWGGFARPVELVAAARNVDPDFAVLGDQRLRARPVAGVPGPARRLGVRLIAEMVSQLDLLARSIGRLVSWLSRPPGPAIPSSVPAPANSSSIISSGNGAGGLVGKLRAGARRAGRGLRCGFCIGQAHGVGRVFGLVVCVCVSRATGGGLIDGVNAEGSGLSLTFGVGGSRLDGECCWWLCLPGWRADLLKGGFALKYSAVVLPVAEEAGVLEEVVSADRSESVPALRLAPLADGLGSVAIVGMGYVGLPTALGLHESSLTVFGVDVSGKRLEAIRGGAVDLISGDRAR